MCGTCYQHKRRNGEDRPEATILRKNIREFDREMEAGARRTVPVPTSGERLRARAEEAYRERAARKRREGSG